MSFSFNSRVGISITSQPIHPNSHIAGTVHIEGTRVDGGTYDDPSTDAFILSPAGIGLFGFPATPIEAQVAVVDNRTTNWSGSGIAVTFANDVLVFEVGNFAVDVTPGEIRCK